VVKIVNRRETSENRMSLLKVVWIWILATVLLFGCARAQSLPSANVLGDEFITAFRQAHERRDLDAMSKLVCWDRVTPELRKLTEAHFKTSFDEKIVNLRLTTEHPQGRTNQYVRNGVTYGFNLPVVAELVVEDAPLSKGASNGSYYPLAVKDGRYCIAEMAPVAGSETQTPIASSSSAARTIQASQGKSADTARPTVVPAKTVFIINLGEDLGLKTVKAGGKFSATVAEPVVVDGVVVIPTGSPVQGSVTKKGDYSPDASLISVSVNGTAHKISTDQVIFNQEIVFPAGSQMKFELLFPLKLSN
jgi:hypothetical protein